MLLGRISLLLEIEDCWLDRLRYGDQVLGSSVKYAVRQATRQKMKQFCYHFATRTRIPFFYQFYAFHNHLVRISLPFYADM